MDKFSNLPLWGKVVAVSGIGLAGYMLVGKNLASNNSSSDSNTSTEDQALAVYPYTNAEDLAAAGYSVDNSSGGYVSNEEFAAWNSSVMDSIAAAANANSYVTDTIAAGDNKTVNLNNGFTTLSGKEGINSYSTKLYADGTKEVKKNGQLVPEENYKYIPATFGGSRDDSKSFIDPNKQLQQAQAAFGSAKTSAEKAAAAKAGQTARAAGATNSGAKAVWQDQSKSNNASVTVVSGANANKQLQAAQAAYGAAKTTAEKAAAAKAGQAARAAGATNAGANAVWQSKKAVG